MTTHLAPEGTRQQSRATHQAFILLRTIFGIDKFTNVLTDWTHYLAPIATDIVPVSPEVFMYGVGIVEIAAGILVALRPGIGSLVIVAWLAGIIVNLLLIPGFFDVGLRDFGLLVGALTLNRLASSEGSAHPRKA